MIVGSGIDSVDKPTPVYSVGPMKCSRSGATARHSQCDLFYYSDPSHYYRENIL